MKKFIQVIRALLKNWKLWVFFPMLSMALVFFLTRNQKRKYVSVGTLNVNLDLKSGLSLSGEALKQYEIGLRFQNIIETVKSKRNLESVRFEILKDAFDQQHDFISFENHSQVIQDSAALISYMDTVLSHNKLLDVRDKKGFLLTSLLDANSFSYESILNALSIFRTGSSNILQVNVTTDNPFKSAYLAEKIISVLIEQNQKSSKHIVGQNRRLLEKLVKNAKGKLDEKVGQLEEYKISNNIINLGEHTKAIANQLVNMRIKLANLKVSKVAQKTALNHVKQTFTDGSPLPINTATNHEILKLNSSLKYLHHQNKQNQFISEIKSTDSLEYEINNKRNKLTRLVTELIDDIPYDLKATRQDLVNRYIEHQLTIEMQETEIPILKKQIDGVMEFASHFAPLESNISTFEREIDVAQKSYLLLLNKLNLASTLEQGAAENEIEILDFPLVPLNPLKSKRAILILAAGIAVGFLIIGFITGIELLDANICTLEAYNEISNLNTLAATPNSNIKDKKNDVSLLASVQTIKRQQLNAIRKVIFENIRNDKLILISSSYKNEGKHWLTYSLYKLLVQQSYKTLIIDADWVSGHEAIEDINLITDSIDELDQSIENGIIRIGSESLAPYDYFSAKKWEALIQNMNTQFDYVFVIAPPMVFSTDWLEWSEIASHNIHVFKANRMFHSLDKSNEEKLINSKLQVLGSVFNLINLSNMDGFSNQIDQKKNWFRTKAKKLIQRDFKSK